MARIAAERVMFSGFSFRLVVARSVLSFQRAFFFSIRVGRSYSTGGIEAARAWCSRRWRALVVERDGAFRQIRTT
jgi:hypothetical protein